MLRELPAVLRRVGFNVRAVLGGEDLIAVEAGYTRGESYGVAFDIGTTTVVATLMNSGSGMAEGVVSTLNGQAPCGADVISRISHAMSGPRERKEPQQAILDTVNQVLRDLYQPSGVGRERVYEAVMAGNATMLHLLLGVDPEPISITPFTPAFREPLYVPARELGIEIHPQGRIQTLPLIAAYVGADIVAGLLASGLARDAKLRLLVDMGTNGESCWDPRGASSLRPLRPARPSRAARSAAA